MQRSSDRTHMNSAILEGLRRKSYRGYAPSSPVEVCLTGRVASPLVVQVRRQVEWDHHCIRGIIHGHNTSDGSNDGEDPQRGEKIKNSEAHVVSARSNPLVWRRDRKIAEFLRYQQEPRIYISPSELSIVTCVL